MIRGLMALLWFGLLAAADPVPDMSCDALARPSPTRPGLMAVRFAPRDESVATALSTCGLQFWEAWMRSFDEPYFSGITQRVMPHDFPRAFLRVHEHALTCFLWRAGRCDPGPNDAAYIRHVATAIDAKIHALGGQRRDLSGLGTQDPPLPVPEVLGNSPEMVARWHASYGTATNSDLSSLITLFQAGRSPCLMIAADAGHNNADDRPLVTLVPLDPPNAIDFFFRDKASKTGKYIYKRPKELRAYQYGTIWPREREELQVNAPETPVDTTTTYRWDGQGLPPNTAVSGAVLWTEVPWGLYRVETRAHAGAPSLTEELVIAPGCIYVIAVDPEKLPQRRNAIGHVPSISHDAGVWSWPDWYAHDQTVMLRWSLLRSDDVLALFPDALSGMVKQRDVTAALLRKSLATGYMRGRRWSRADLPPDIDTALADRILVVEPVSLIGRDMSESLVSISVVNASGEDGL
jgi:hypothetical protein